MAFIIIDKDKEQMRSNMREQMRRGGYRTSVGMRGDGYEQGYRHGYKDGWDDSEDDMHEEEHFRRRDSRGRFM